MLLLPFGSQILFFLTKMWGNTAAGRPLVAVSGVWSIPAVFKHALLIQPTNSLFYGNLISKPAMSQLRNPFERLDYQESLWIHLTFFSGFLLVHDSHWAVEMDQHYCTSTRDLRPAGLLYFRVTPNQSSSFPRSSGVCPRCVMGLMTPQHSLIIRNRAGFKEIL